MASKYLSPRLLHSHALLLWSLVIISIISQLLVVAGATTVEPAEEDEEEDSQEKRRCLSRKEKEEGEEQATRKAAPGLGCSTEWDGLYCWPATKPGVTTRRPCSSFGEHFGGPKSTGEASRTCTAEGTWKGNSTNYTECRNRTERGEPTEAELVQQTTRVIVLLGSLVSLFCVYCMIHVFKSNPNLRSERFIILIQLMLAIFMASLLLFVLTGPRVFPGVINWDYMSWICNMVITIHTYAYMVVNFWIVVHGHLLNKLVELSGFDDQLQMQKVFLFCWGVPIIPCTLWFFLMGVSYGSSSCWTAYENSELSWIIAFPLLAANITHLGYIGHIMFVLMSRNELTLCPSRREQKWTATKITIMLLLMIGFSNSFLIFKPGARIHEQYYYTRAVCQSWQGAMFALICCIFIKDIRRSIRNLLMTVCPCLGEAD